MRPSTQSFASSNLRQPATCSAVNTSGICSNIESEPEARTYHRGTSWTRHDVTTADPVEVIPVSQVVKIDFEIHVVCQRIRSHRIEGPIRVDETSVDGVAEATIDKTRAATEVKTGRQAIGGPNVERVRRSVD